MKLATIPLLTIVLISSSAFGGKLELYDCNKEFDALQCNVNCKKNNGQLEFKVNSNGNKVIRYSYKDGNFVQSISFENCVVVDSDNWECRSLDNSRMSTAIMRNGIHSFTSTYKSQSKLFHDTFFCAK